MRFGMIAAAAAALLCAGQADAARYYEFQIKAQTPELLNDPITGLPTNVLVLSNILVSFDTLTSMIATGGATYGYSVSFSGSSLSTLNMPGGNVFSLSFDPNAISFNQDLVPLAATGFVGHIPCQRNACGFTRTGSLISFAGRTSDVAPAFIGLRDTSTSIVVGVPEPATWGLMLVGVAFVGGAIRRRKAPQLAAA